MINSTLSQRYKSNALKQAIQIFKSNDNKKVKTSKKPYSRFKGHPIIDGKCVSIEEGCNTFDLYLKLSTMIKGKPIYIPIRKTKVLNKWLALGWTLSGSIELRHNTAILFVKKEKNIKQDK